MAAERQGRRPGPEGSQLLGPGPVMYTSPRAQISSAPCMGHLCPPQKDPSTGANSGASRMPGPDGVTEPLHSCGSGLPGSDEPKSPAPAPADVSCVSVPCSPESRPRGHFSEAWAVLSWPVCAAAPRASPHLSSPPRDTLGPPGSPAQLSPSTCGARGPPQARPGPSSRPKSNAQ